MVKESSYYLKPRRNIQRKKVCVSKASLTIPLAEQQLGGDGNRFARYDKFISCVESISSRGISL